jgi:amino acid adenylation domain-containing protein
MKSGEAVAQQPTEDVRPRLDLPLAAPPSGARILERFLATCRDRPTATAIVHPGGSWTYAQLELASRALAARLLALPGEDDVVALYSRRSGELVVGMLACLRAGLTFAVLDAAYPIERIQLLLEVLRPGRFVAIGDADPALALPKAVLRLDAAVMAALLAGDGAGDDRVDVARADIAYLLFTSGTTGVPKCIATSHAPLVHFIAWYERTFAVDHDARFSLLSGLGHDPVLRDIFVPLSTGAQLHVPPHATVLDPVKLHAWLAEARITHAHVTPQLSRIICAGRRGATELALRFVFSGGDTLRSKQATELVAAAPGVRVVNFYGSTETPQAMGYHVFEPLADAGADAVPVGRGIDDVQLHVLDDALEPATVGTRGQIAIRTRFLSEGYRGDAGLTNKKFVANPRATDAADRLYLTGDVGRARPDGAVVIEGRLDDQVKIRGFRVELGDVVHQLQRLAEVKEAVVLAERLPDGESRLVAYLVGTQATAAVRDAMTAAVPPYMVPTRFVWLPAFPLLPNGKIDRAALAKLEPVDEAAPAQALDPIEATIAEKWKQLLARRSIDVESSFIDLGGDSLSFIEASVHLEELLGKLPDRWERLSIRELARAKHGARTGWTSVDSSVLLRAISIVAVVIGHYELPNLAGSVLALFVVSGMSFGRYLAPQVVKTESISPITRLVLKIAIPAILYSILVNFAFRFPKWPGMLLANNLVSPDSHVSGVGFWYIDVLVQCFVILAVLLSIPAVRRVLARNPFPWLIGATFVFDAVALGAPYIVDTSHLDDRLPHIFLCCVFLGWALIHADTMLRKALVMVATVPSFATFAWQSESYVWFPFVATVFLLFSDRVSLPLYVGRLVNIVASASLFIYLTDHQVELALSKLGIAPGAIMVLTAVIVGIVVWKLWELASAIALRLQRRLVGRAP